MSYICIHETVQLILFQSITLTQRVSGLVYYVENNLFFYLQLQTLEVFYFGPVVELVYTVVLGTTASAISVRVRAGSHSPLW